MWKSNQMRYLFPANNYILAILQIGYQNQKSERDIQVHFTELLTGPFRFTEWVFPYRIPGHPPMQGIRTPVTLLRGEEQFIGLGYILVSSVFIFSGNFPDKSSTFWSTCSVPGPFRHSSTKESVSPPFTEDNWSIGKFGNLSKIKIQLKRGGGQNLWASRVWGWPLHSHFSP